MVLYFMVDSLILWLIRDLDHLILWVDGGIWDNSIWDPDVGEEDGEEDALSERVQVV